MFITEAILNGLPPHIAQVIAGHRNINTTMGYAAIYPVDALEAHRAFIARRRDLRPAEDTGLSPPQRGRSSCPTSSGGSWRWASADGPTEPTASTNTPASAARS